MGGMRNARTAHTARPMALGSAVATLLAALFLCMGQTHTGGAGAAREHGTHRETGETRAAGRVGETTPAVPGAARADSAAYTCPYDRGHCGLFPHLTPGVLTAPPEDSPPAPAGLPSGALPARDASGPPSTGALPRAPDLHVLQVLRT
ncbi:hypothetical protein [Streptomyces sp. WMMC940]|uniref:hypothetical protein n=1 Tax=Streptomyces sp. WMMC940 TaxID=3015153 RepID=UPI0022B746B0|nr:hypothetical protein [Streptomyces sp. WMMC940]MCZ7460730.1 hypothetical protein [Streptomyces sp. WMMC940]